MAGASLPPSGWYADPETLGGERYWNGEQWTEERRAAAPASWSPPASWAPPAGPTPPESPAPVPPAPPSAAPPFSSPIPLYQPGHPPPPPVGFGAPPPYGVPYGATRSTNGFAIASLVLGILWLLWLGSLLAVIFGHIAIGQVNASGGRQHGKGLAIAGLVLGYLGLGVFLLAIAAAE